VWGRDGVGFGARGSWVFVCGPAGACPQM
jgi:hypothetical protein